MHLLNSQRKAAAIACSLALTLMAAWVLLTGPMLVKIRFGPLPADPRMTIWNPTRNRAPERYANALLSGIQSNRCQQFVEPLGILEEDKAKACSKQQTDPVSSYCSLVDRTDKGKSVWLLFHCPYVRRTEARAEIGLSIERGESGWLLRSYDRIY